METMSTEVERVEGDQEFDSRSDRIIWRSVGVKSVRQVAEELGLSPERVLRRKKELLEEIDVLTIQEKRAQLLVSLQDIADQTQRDYDSAPWEFKAGIANSAVASMKVVLAELARAEKKDSADIDALNSMRVRELVELMSAVVNSGVREVSARFGLDEDEIYEIFNHRLIEEARARDIQ